MARESDGEGRTTPPFDGGERAPLVAPDPGRVRPKYRAWAELMRRAFEADVLACPRCGGRMVVLATIEDPGVIYRILTHLGRSTEAGEPLRDRALPRAEESPA